MYFALLGGSPPTQFNPRVGSLPPNSTNYVLSHSQTEVIASVYFRFRYRYRFHFRCH
jgi:hypothetical protein